MLDKQSELRTERLVLKSISEKDNEELASMLLNEEIKKTYMIPDFKNNEELNHMIKRFIEISNDLKRYLYGIYLSDTLIGFVNDVLIDCDEIELGYVIDPKYKGSGYMSEALEASIKELFRIGYKRVVAGAFIENKASQRVMEKCHMTKMNKTDSEEYQGIIHQEVYYMIEKKVN